MALKDVTRQATGVMGRRLTRRQEARNRATERAGGRTGDTAGTYRDRSLLSGPMYRGTGQNRNLGI